MEANYNNKFRKVLFEKISAMTRTEHEEIFKILGKYQNDLQYSRNKNGIFFNLSSLDDKVVEEINNFVNYCINNKKQLDDYDKKINECKINNNLTHIMVSLDEVPKQSMKESVEDWNAIAGDSRSIQKITTFIEKLMCDQDRLGKKKVNQKFSNAKKKYAKKTCIERKFEIEDSVELASEPYVII